MFYIVWRCNGNKVKAKCKFISISLRITMRMGDIMLRCATNTALGFDRYGVQGIMFVLTELNFDKGDYTASLRDNINLAYFRAVVLLKDFIAL